MRFGTEIDGKLVLGDGDDFFLACSSFDVKFINGHMSFD